MIGLIVYTDSFILLSLSRHPHLLPSFRFRHSPYNSEISIVNSERMYTSEAMSRQ